MLGIDSNLVYIYIFYQQVEVVLLAGMRIPGMDPCNHSTATVWTRCI